MTDKTMKDVLARSYAVPEFDESTADRIKRKALAPSSRSRSRRIWRGLLFAGAMLAVTAYAYPIVSANLLAFAVARKLNSPEAYTMILDADGGKGPGQELQIYHGAIASVESPGVTYLIDEKGIGRSIDTETHTAVNQGSAADSLLLMPRKLIPFLSTLNASRRLTRLDDGKIYGKAVSRYRLMSDEKTIAIEIAIYNDSGELADFRWTPQTGGNLPVPIDLDMRFSYEPNAKAKFDKIAKSYDHEVILSDIDKTLAKLSERPLTKAIVGKETITIYRYERTASGAVFLLYTIAGPDEGSGLPFVRLQDSGGHQWLPDGVALSPVTKLAGHQVSEEILYPPVGVDNVPFELSVLANLESQNMDLLPDTRFQPLRMPGFKTQTVAELTPTPISRVPDWFYFKSSFVGWATFRNYGTAMQIHDLVNRKEYEMAVKLGEKLLPMVAPDDHIHLGTRRRVILDLGISYLALGRHEQARRYLLEAIQETMAGHGEANDFLKSLREACHQEGIAVPEDL